MIKKRVVIIGAGPTGLSAGYLLKKSGFKDFIILEKNSYAGGLSTSFKDKKGFTWDLGGHVIHSKNKEFTSFCKQILRNNLAKINRKAFIYFRGKFIPYPFQDNIAFLPKKYKIECLNSLIENNKQLQNSKSAKSNNFKSWILNNFGSGIARHFMIPQNQKSWQYPLNKIDTNWLYPRISLTNLKKIKIECHKTLPKKLNWGSHQIFYYPKIGGIGFLWKKTAETFKSKVMFNSKIINIDLSKKIILVKQKNSLIKKIKFDYLISSCALNDLIKILNAPTSIKKSALQLKYNSGLIVGLGYSKKPIIHDWHWIYFPQKKIPFFRLCLISNFGGKVIPKSYHSSFLAEISWRGKKPNQKKLLNKINKLIRKNFFKGETVRLISTFNRIIPNYYPIPTLHRDKALKKINMFLNSQDIYSLGRFGSWKYETGNMDDCFIETDHKDLINIIIN